MLEAVINTNANGDTQIVAGVSGKRIKVTSLVLEMGGTANVKFTDGAAGTALTGPLPMVAQDKIVLAMAAMNPIGGQEGYFRTSQGKDLTLNLSAGVQASGFLTYVLEP